MARAGFVFRFLKPCAVAAVLGFLAACGGGGGGEPVRTVTTVTVSSPTTTPRQGDTVQLTAVARDQSGEVMSGTTASWSSSAPSVATVSATGLLQALAGGSVTVTATISNVPGTLMLTITPRVTTTVTVSSPTASPTVGETVQLTVVARDQFGDLVTGRTATWSSSAPSIATVSATGLLQALAPGAVTATATIDGVPGSLSLTVTPRTVASVAITSPTPSPRVGESVQLVATARDAKGDVIPGTTASWSTSDAGIATVSAIGVLQGQSTGAVVVTATISGVSGSLPLMITARATASVTINSPTLLLRAGDKMQLTASARDASGAVIPGKTATWASSNAGITQTGLLYTPTQGNAVVTATIDGISATQSLTVSSPRRVSVTVGPKEVVFRYATDRCNDLDVPDNPPRIVRAEDGSLVFFSGNGPRYFVSRGTNFDSLKRDCSRPALESTNRLTPESYENLEWLYDVYREGSRWHALIHNEYFDPFASTCSPGNPTPSNPCWYDSVTYGVSTDGARSFTKPLAPVHTVAPPPYVWMPPSSDTPRNPLTGGFTEMYGGTRVFRALDGYFYTWVWAIPTKSDPANMGWCVLRTDRLEEPASWRAWDGNGFNMQLTNPYVTGRPGPLCTYVQLQPMDSYNTYLESYMHVGIGPVWVEGKKVCGVYFQLAANLFVESPQQLIIETFDERCDVDAQKPGLLEPVVTGHTALIDHADPTANFERPGRTAYLYYVRYPRSANDPLYWLDRDVVRVPLTFTRLD